MTLTDRWRVGGVGEYCCDSGTKSSTHTPKSIILSVKGYNPSETVLKEARKVYITQSSVNFFHQCDYD